MYNETGTLTNVDGNKVRNTLFFFVIIFNLIYCNIRTVYFSSIIHFFLLCNIALSRCNITSSIIYFYELLNIEFNNLFFFKLKLLVKFTTSFETLHFTLYLHILKINELFCFISQIYQSLILTNI